MTLLVFVLAATILKTHPRGLTGISHCLQPLAAENYLDPGHSHGLGYADMAGPKVRLRADGDN